MRRESPRTRSERCRITSWSWCRRMPQRSHRKPLNRSFKRYAATGLVETGPFDSSSFCTIEIGEAISEISCFTSCDVVPPICPACNHRFEEWGDILSTWFDDQASFRGWNCPGCGKDCMPWELDWHRRWGFGRFSIDIRGVHLGEAVPSDELLALLSEATNQSWSYFYTHM